MTKQISIQISFHAQVTSDFRERDREREKEIERDRERQREIDGHRDVQNKCS